MDTFQLRQIGTIHSGDDGFAIELEPRYREALTGLDGFSHIQILWWFDQCDTPEARDMLTERAPYCNGPETMGVFATRSPNRPNPIALSSAYVTYLDTARGVVHLAYIDAHDGSPVLDIKPYTPSLDRAESPEVPAWCGHWPKSMEESGDFDWEAEFNF